MATKILSLYLRAGTGIARLAFTLTERAVMLAGSAIGLSGRDGAPAPRAEPRTDQSEAAPEAQAAAAEAQPAAPGAQGAAADPAAPQAETPDLAAPPSPTVDEVVEYDAEPATPLDPAEEVVKTVDDEPELVDALAEPGAEDGAGAAVEVDEPWKDYGGMNADAVIARLREASAAELALVELYERSHRRRQTVLSAAERRHKELSGPAAS
jgi:light-harvesting protein B-800-850 alpha chain